MGCGEATLFALKEMRTHGLGKLWKFALGNSRQDYGSCDFATKTIEVSIFFLSHATREESRDTIRHEIAHALVGNHLHDSRWKEIARRIGARPSAQPRYENEKERVGSLRLAGARKRKRRQM